MSAENDHTLQQATSNGRKASIMLEETGLKYNVHPMALEQKEQNRTYLSFNPNGRIPCIVDDDGQTESRSLVQIGFNSRLFSRKVPNFIPNILEGMEVYNWLFLRRAT